MLRIILLALAAALLLLPATADGHSGVRLRGIVTVEDATRSFVTVSSARRDHVLRVQPASLDRIRLGMRVELRGSTLRRHGNGSRVLSRGVILVRSDTHAGDVLELDDDEIEVKGTLTSLSPLRVTVHGRVFTCAVPVGVSLAGFHVGDFVEMTCDLVGGTFVVRELELADDDLDEDERDDDDDEDDDNDDDGDDNSGPGSGDDEDDED